MTYFIIYVLYQGSWYPTADVFNKQTTCVSEAAKLRVQYKMSFKCQQVKP